MGARGTTQVTSSLGGCPSLLFTLLGSHSQAKLAGDKKLRLPFQCPSQGHVQCPPRLPRQAVNSGQRRAGGAGDAGCRQQVLSRGAGRRPAELNMQLLSSQGTLVVWADATEDRKQTGQRLLLQLYVHFLMAVGSEEGFFFPPRYNSHIIPYSPFRMYNSVVLSRLMRLCNHHHDLISSSQKNFHQPQKKPHAH